MGPLMKKLIAGVIAVAILWLIWPYYALYELANSLNQADPVGLERRIDWGSVRQGLREDLNTFLLRNVAQEMTGQGLPGAALGAGLAGNDRAFLGQKSARRLCYASDNCGFDRARQNERPFSQGERFRCTGGVKQGNPPFRYAEVRIFLA